MFDLNHREFDPSFNRIYSLPVSADHPRTKQHVVDPEDPYYPIHTGVHTDTFCTENGEEYSYVFCIPSTVKPSGNTVFVLGSDGQTSQELFEQGNWQEKLEKYSCAGCFIVPDKAWDYDHPGAVIDYFMNFYARMRDLEYYASNLDSIYVIGCGTGAYAAGLLASLYSTIVTAAVAAGSHHVPEELLSVIGKLPSDGDPNVLKKDNPLPTWIVDADGSGKAFLEYAKNAVRVAEEDLCNRIACVWKQAPRPGTLYLNEQPVSEVWYSDSSMPTLSADEFADRALAFVTRYKRWGGIHNRHLRLAKSPEDMGLIYREILFEGRKRRWHIYEPSAYKNGLKKEYPLVLAIHGFSCSGPFFAENSNWDAVAEERGLIVAFPTAYPYLRTKFRDRISYNAPTPAWNSDPEGNENTDAPDDVAFLCELVDIMCRDYPIDKTRIYVSGHSNGSAMTQALLRYAPDRFAAFGPIGGMEGTFKPELAPLPGSIKRPVWYIMGEYDMGPGAKLEPGNGNDRTLRNAAKTNLVNWDERKHYTSGIYENYVGYDSEHVPMVRFTGVTGWPHTVSPETSLILYDEFFSKFQRQSDGSITYLG